MPSNSDLQWISYWPWWCKTTRVSHPNFEMSLKHFYGCQHPSQSTSSSSTITTSPTTCTSTSTFPKVLTKPRFKDVKEKCGKCSGTLWSNTVPVRCNRCNKGYHPKCSTGPKASSHDINWNCNKFTKILQKFSSVNIIQPSAPTSTTPSQQLPAQSRDKLTIIQWKNNGIHPKLL